MSVVSVSLNKLLVFVILILAFQFAFANKQNPKMGTNKHTGVIWKNGTPSCLAPNILSYGSKRIPKYQCHKSSELQTIEGIVYLPKNGKPYCLYIVVIDGKRKVIKNYQVSVNFPHPPTKCPSRGLRDRKFDDLF